MTKIRIKARQWVIRQIKVWIKHYRAYNIIRWY